MTVELKEQQDHGICDYRFFELKYAYSEVREYTKIPFLRPCSVKMIIIFAMGPLFQNLSSYEKDIYYYSYDDVPVNIL